MAVTYIILFLLAVAADVLILFLWRKKNSQRKGERPNPSDNVWLLGAPSPAIRALKRLYRRYPRLEQTRQSISHRMARLFQALSARAPQVEWLKLLSLSAEVALIILWAAWTGRKMLNLAPDIIPNGNEFSNLVQTHYIWTLLPRCGWCFLWNGFINGGAPALAELHGAVLHPLVFIPVLLWGVNNGAKITLVCAMALAGLAQWGLARALKLGWLVRLWSGLITVVSGPLAGKMEVGILEFVLGQACAILVIAYGVDLLYNRNRKALVGFAFAMTLLMLSGGGYLQVGLMVLLLPTLALFCLLGRPDQPPAWKDLLLAFGLSLLFAGIFLVPLLHFLPEIKKDADFTLGIFQPLEYIPLNLVIRDVSFFYKDVLGKQPFPYNHITFIGWIPVVLALLTLRLSPTRYRPVLRIFGAGIILVFLLTSLEAPQFLLQYLPQVSLLRHFPVATGFVVPFIVALAAISLDQLQLLICRWITNRGLKQAKLAGVLSLALVLPLTYYSIRPCYELSQVFLNTHSIARLSEEVSMAATSSAQWVMPPIGDFDWVNAALSQGMKITGTWRPWDLKKQFQPPFYIEAVHSLPAIVPAAVTAQQNGYRRSSASIFMLHPRSDYAFIMQKDRPIDSAYLPCPATSQGGWIDITCKSQSAGTLMLNEYAWDGWWAWVDDHLTQLTPGMMLSVQAPAGQHHYRFRYLPWDVLLGALLTIGGVTAAMLIQRRINHQSGCSSPSTPGL